MQISKANPVSIANDIVIKTSIIPDSSLQKYQSIQSSEYYESAILADETLVSNYWYLGLSYLLAGREEDAQATWFVPLSEANDIELDSYTDELVAILEQEAIQQSQIPNLELEWLIRQHLWMLKPDRVENILRLIIIENTFDRLTLELLSEWQIAELLKMISFGTIDNDLLEEVVGILVKKIHTDLGLDIVKSCLSLLEKDSQNILIRKLVNASFQIFHQQNLGLYAIKLVETCQSFLPNDLDICQVLTGLYSGVDLHLKAIDTAQHCYKLASDRFEQLFASYIIQRSYLTAGNWQGYRERLDLHREIQQNIISDSQKSSQRIQRQSLIVSSFFSLYTEDNPTVNRPLQNQISKIYQDNINPLLVNSEFEELSLKKRTGMLRIGYLASTLKEHSVGWLSRWLFHYHDRQSFQIFNYCINQSPQNSFNHKWFRDKVDVSYYFNNPDEIAAQIKADEIDILIDLDSITFDLSCMVMAHKPAPVQATWLGLDASGLPAIDYFIVDPYVLPDDAQDYYQEKLWRLPQTYLAVDGFEVGISTFNRRDLDIADDAVIYFSSQGGYKRHPDNIRCQIKIIKAVPNSYLLIKGKSDPDMIRDLFGKICEQEGISLDRLRFLPGVSDEYTHRANLAIADVVLDTFPYNGATTTLETLWMGIPMVTQVGQQFAARNSYTFMLNAGITEGIAWSQEEYIEWGIKLGLDRELRMQVREKLRCGRQTAPVWNAKQFTLDMEQAYREMWAKYQAQQDNRSIDLHDHN